MFITLCLHTAGRPYKNNPLCQRIGFNDSAVGIWSGASCGAYLLASLCWVAAAIQGALGGGRLSVVCATVGGEPCTSCCTRVKCEIFLLQNDLRVHKRIYNACLRYALESVTKQPVAFTVAGFSPERPCVASNTDDSRATTIVASSVAACTLAVTTHIPVIEPTECCVETPLQHSSCGAVRCTIFPRSNLFSYCDFFWR